MIASITLTALGFFWVGVCFVLTGAWCAALEVGYWRNRRRVAHRRAARGGFLYDRERERIGL